MAAAQVFLLGLVVMAVTAAPQFDFDSSEEDTSYEFSYGVSNAETGDAKEHKESVSPNGRTEGEYRWLQPNGLYMIVRYFVEGDSGFQATVSEESGPEITNHYTNTMTQENSGGVPLPIANQGFAKSIDAAPAVNAISQSRGFRTQPQPQQSFRTQSQPQQSFRSQPSQNTRSQGRQNFGVPLQSTSTFGSQQQQNSGNIIDGGFIDGGIIDGGIIDGGIIDGGIIDGGFINDDSFEDRRFG